MDEKGCRRVALFGFERDFHDKRSVSDVARVEAKPAVNGAAGQPGAQFEAGASTMPWLDEIPGFAALYPGYVALVTPDDRLPSLRYRLDSKELPAESTSAVPRHAL
jgi:hypothetical protein